MNVGKTRQAATLESVRLLVALGCCLFLADLGWDGDHSRGEVGCLSRALAKGLMRRNCAGVKTREAAFELLVKRMRAYEKELCWSQKRML